ncbi:MAG: O-antigen ligase family protein [Phycisphaerae bacterium]|nr:O-antigen ligase family protein [Phycisphaerae bacterium]
MALINRFEPAPRAWPPSRDPHAIADLIEYAERRDPIGHQVHVALACLYAFCLGLSTAAETVAFVALVGYAALRLPNTWRTLTPWVTHPIVVCMTAIVAWAALSGLWVADRSDWRDALGALRGVLVVPALIPVMRAWRPILGSMVAGMSLQAVLQILQVAGLIPTRIERTHVRFAGLQSNPVLVSLMQAICLVFVVTQAVVCRSWRVRGALAAVAALLVAGVAIAAGRGAILGVAASLPVVAFLLLRHHGVRLRAIVLTGLLAAALAGGVAVGVAAIGGQGLKRQAGDVMAIDDPRTSTGQRLLWWKAGLRAFASHPVAGVGFGGSREMLAEDEVVRATIVRFPEVPAETFVVAHPHSTYVQTAAELGAVGVVLLVALYVALAMATLRAARRSTVAAAVAGALVIWAISAGFEAMLLSSRTTGVAGILIVLGVFAATSDRTLQVRRGPAPTPSP